MRVAALPDGRTQVDAGLHLGPKRASVGEGNGPIDAFVQALTTQVSEPLRVL